MTQTGNSGAFQILLLIQAQFSAFPSSVMTGMTGNLNIFVMSHTCGRGFEEVCSEKLSI